MAEQVAGWVSFEKYENLLEELNGWRTRAGLNPLKYSLAKPESFPHDISPLRLRQIAQDLEAEGWYTQAATIWYASRELETLQNKA